MTFFWMDGYEPNTSSKSNRKGAWAATCTFVLYDLMDQSVYYVGSSLFAAGPGKGHSSDNHSCIFRQMVEENIELKYENGKHKPIQLISMFHQMKFVNFYICHMGSLMDNPERRANFCLLAGNSKNHGIFGISCYFDYLQLPFQACLSCYKHYKEYTLTGNWSYSPTNQLCDKCYGYSIDRLLKYGKYHSPIVDLPNADNAPGLYQAYKPGELTCNLLIRAWSYAIK